MPRTAKCPICDKPPATAHAPFCSERCQKVDLHRWLGGTYAIHTDEAPDPLSGQPLDED